MASPARCSSSNAERDAFSGNDARAAVIARTSEAFRSPWPISGDEIRGAAPSQLTEKVNWLRLEHRYRLTNNTAGITRAGSFYEYDDILKPVVDDGRHKYCIREID